ncbi:fatty acid synthase [Mycena alexandri]|uniref:Fatty acid synthase n=1 Tax=Mycena alexandri TaxID=1745969 RepID=A0AAD6S2R6_9AGAR|nr:fatty acid synthase [Mycena alexandri]
MPVDTTAQLENEAEATVELAARFLGYIPQKLNQIPESVAARTSLLLNVFKHFTSTYLHTKDIHSLAASYDTEVRKTVLASYFLALAALRESNVADGTNEVYFDELQSLYDTYKPFVSSFLAKITTDALLPLVAAQKSSSHYIFGLDVVSWLCGAEPRPSTAYLASVPYLVACNVAGMTPGQFRDTLSGATGHSQGIVSAVAISASDSFESYTANALKAVRWLFFSGLRGQEAFPVVALEPSIVEDSLEGGEGAPSPMLSVTGLKLAELEVHIKKTNTHLAENSQLSVSLHNGPRAFVVTGPARSLYGLVTHLRKVRAPSGLDQSKTPFSQRKPVFSVRFLVVGVPYHSAYLAGATQKLIGEDLGGEELWKAGDLKIPVFNTEDGTDLRQLATSITQSLCEQIFTRPIHCATHAVDFGPGGLSGIGPLTAKNLDGRGVRVIVVGDRAKGDAELYDSQNVKYEDWWSKKFAPGLVKTSDGTIYLDTPFSRLLGKPPIMVAGMTPSTVKGGFVSAVLNAGYHVELAGGGHYNAAALRSKVAEIQSQIPPGVGITLNALYINPRQFGFQLPLWQEMRKEGLPIEGFCAAEIIDGLRSAGIRHVAFKPGSVEGIRQVWTGGRAGGHHSYEDFHQPVLQTYRAIRQQGNISLVGGSGFGAAEDVWPYLSGEWSVQHEMQPMPFDGFLFASRVMVAKEAHTSSSVKDLIVAAAGVDDGEWEGTYAKPTGGILTVKSELGEPIHKVATRGVKLWKEFDDTVFKLPKEKRVAWLAERRDEVIGKLNKDFSKPWFGWKKDGSVAKELGDMTYEETVLRMVRLMFVSHEKRWVDVSLRNLTGDWLRRVEERFAGVNGGGDKPSLLQSYTSLDDPLPFIESFLKEYPIATRQLLASEDSAFFLAISQRAGQKPVPFIPVLDASFEVWFKKDSLWAAEDIEAVFDQDPQRVCILQGPMAVKHSKVKDEPIKDSPWEHQLGARAPSFSSSGTAATRARSPPSITSAPRLRRFPALPNLKRTEANGEVVYEFGARLLPNKAVWLNTLAGPELSWLRALAGSKTIKVVVAYDGASPVSVTVYGAARSYGQHKPTFKAVEIKFTAASKLIDVTLFEDRRDVSVPLALQFEYKPSLGFAPIHEIATGRNTRIKEFYWKLWYGDDAVLPEIDIRETFHGPEVTIEASAVEQFCAVVGNQGESFKTVRNDQVSAPMDFAIVTGWQAIMKSIFPSSIDGDLLKLVHLSNGFRMVNGANPLQVGDVCKAEANIVSVTNTDAGKVVKVKGHVFRAGKPVIEVISAFLYRGRFTDYQNTFETTEEPDYVVTLESDAAVGVLQSKEWFEWIDESKPLLAGTSLIFRVKSQVSFKDKTSYREVSVTGEIFQDDSRGNPVVAYIQRHGTPQGLATPLANEGYTLTNASGATIFNAPLTNEPYSKISGDFNPIHINPYFSCYAALPATITHGLWSSAATRRYIENVVAKGHPDRVLAYNVLFVGMVLPGDELNVKIKHVGMRDGNIVVNIVTSNAPRAVWDGADAHLLAVYGFSIVEIVKDNPKEKTVHFGGIKGQAIRRRYMDMTYDTMDKDGNVKTLPLFADIDPSPTVLLFATQFAQIALVVTEKAAFEDMRMKGFVQKDCAFAGHSLGEYSALASIADVLAISALVDVVFYRGITMQRAVERDAENRSNYAMCASVDSIATSTGTLLEIVNYNVEGQQYVCAGELVALQTMTNVLNYLKVQKIDIAKLTETFTVEKVKEMLGDIVTECHTRATEQQKAEGYIKLERGFATIPLPGIDVPFHSRYLWAGVMPFRAYLSKKINVAHLNPDMLIGKYIPNLIAIPFDVTKEYAQIIYDQTSSPRLDKVLKRWDQENWASDEQRQKLAYIILVELLAYQFASPVRWIQTQDRLFTDYSFERLIELGPSPTLTGMATRTLKAKYETKDDSISRTRTILCHAKNVKEIYYQFEDELEAASPSDSAAESASPAPVAAAAAPAPAPLPPSRTVPIKAIDILSVIVAQKLKKQVNEVPLSKSIKELVGGKSTLQNEILGDLQMENFPWRNSAQALLLGSAALSGSTPPGLVSRVVGGKMPGGFNSSAIKSYLSKSWGLGSGRADGSWLDGIVAIYAQRSGISLSSGSSGGAGGATINSEEFIKFQSDQEKFAAQHTALDQEKANSLALQTKLDNIAKEHGDVYIEGIQPMFDPLKARHFDSSWNWVRQDALLMFYDIIFGRLTTLLAYMQYNIDHCDPSKGDNYKLAKNFGQQLIDNTREAIGQPPVYKDVTFPTAPHTEVTAKGDIVYSEVVRENVRKLEAYSLAPVNINKVQDDVLKLWTVVKSQPGISQEQKNRIKALYEGVVRSLRKSPETTRPRNSPRQRRSSSQFLRPQLPSATSVSADKVPLLHLKRKVGTNWEYSSNLTGVYLDILHEIATSGTTFKDKNALLTGVGKGSIGVEIVKGLLSGGAHVVITTSRYSRSTVEYYQSIFQTFGSAGSALTVVPFNQGSKQDVEALVDYIYANLGMDLDYIIPFAGVPENGREIDSLDDKSELAHRIMLVNLLRILGAVKSKKASRHFVTRPTQVILPLSPNHGLFGNDGLYSESKISLETLFQRWSSESWGEYLCLAGAVIGWTRGTGLMGPTNIVAHELESYGVRTFSSKEMAFNILGLMHPLLFSITQVEPIWADLNGGMDKLPDLADITGRIRSDLMKKSELRRAIALDNSADFKVVNGVEAERLLQTVNVTPRANFRFDFPTLEAYENFSELSSLQGMVDLDRVMVITGFAEVGPWGSSRTRWEMEARGEFTIEGCIEMAWIMGYIKHFDGRLKDGSLYVGWVDSKTAEPVDDKDVKGRYQKDILEHAGVRLIEPELFRGYDPKKKVFNQEIELIHDLEPIEVAESEAHKFKLQHGDKCDVWAGEGGQWFFKLKKGALVFVPKSFSFNRTVAGQIPTGWHAGRYGIPDDIIAQADRATLWALEVGTSLGSGMGGTVSMAKMFKDRRDEREVQNDILQETFINTTAGWVNLLLMSSSGPVKIPVGACATALQSLEIACDTILSGKAKVMIAGGFDDLSEEGSFEFANMKATSNAESEFAMGPRADRNFMESQGTGVHIVMSAKTALELGAPIRGILAFTSTSTDKAGRSIPAPGLGPLTVAREVSSKHPLPILDLAYRSRQLAFRRTQISQWLTHEHSQLQEELQIRKTQGEPVDDEYFASRVANIEKEAAQQDRDVLAMYGMLEGTDPRISPLRRALAVWGFDRGRCRCPIYSWYRARRPTLEENETRIWNDIFTTIARTPGNAVPIMAQKSIVGHSKGGSAAWQMAGLLQTVNTGIIPGNRNSDNIDSHFKERRFLMFPSKSIHTDGIRAGVMSSFGFGQVGGIALVVHPRYLFATLEPSHYEAYKERHAVRALQSYKSMSEMMIKNSLVKIKETPPYSPDLEAPVLLNSLARASLDPKTGSYRYQAKLASGELISAVPSSNPTFVTRNFTPGEIAYCRAQPSPPSSFAARWAGKEAGAAAAMLDIEILNDEATGAPAVRLHGDAKKAANEQGVSKTVAIAFAQATSS